ncbi:MAG: hypothetical protein ABW082_00540 [Sedimenticola sp.]
MLLLIWKQLFHKIADPRDITSTAGVSFTINHIAAVTIPVLFGFLWMVSPASVFLAGVGQAQLGAEYGSWCARDALVGCFFLYWVNRRTTVVQAEGIMNPDQDVRCGYYWYRDFTEWTMDFNLN